MDVYSQYRNNRRGCSPAVAICIIAAFLFAISCACCGCASTKSLEKVNTRDSTVYHHVYDTTHVTITDTSRVEQHIVVTDSSTLSIQFGAGGGTYNAKTGQATNVTGVQESSKRTEQRDSIAKLNIQLELATASRDSLQSAVSQYQSEIAKERTVPKRSGWDRFCTWWFLITALLLLIKIAAWVMEKIPMTAPYVMIARKFIPFL